MPKLWPQFLVFAIGALVRALYSFEPYLYLNWDEAPQALMARQIAAGKILPLVHFQLPYIGAVEQYPLALAMLVLGDDIATLRLFYFALSVLSLGAIIAYHQRILPPAWALVASAFFALCPPMVLLLSVQSYSFGGLMAFSALILLGLSHLDRLKYSKPALFSLGLLNGLSLYNNILALAILAFCIWSVYATRPIRTIRFFTIGIFIGYAPMLAFNLANDFVSYKMLVAKFLGVTQQMVTEQGEAMAIASGFAAKLSGRGPSGFDIESLYRLPAIFAGDARPLQTAGLLLILALVAVAYGTLAPKAHHSSASRASFDYNIRLAYYACTGLLFILALGQVRYMTALLPVLPLVLSEALSALWHRRKTPTAIAGAFLVCYLAFAHLATYAQYRNNSSRDPIHTIHEILAEKGLHYGYGSYEYQTSIAFLSQEQIKISTQIGPIYMDKIPLFSQLVDQREDVFYILPADSTYIRPLIDRQITYQIETFQHTWILWDFSQRVYPLDLLSEDELARPDGYYRWSYRERPSVLNGYRGGH